MSVNFKKLNFLRISAPLLLLAACSTPSVQEAKPVKELAESVKEDSGQSVKNIERAFIVDTGKIQVVSEHFKVEEKPVLPDVFNNYFAFRWEVPFDYKKIFSSIGEESRVNIRITSDAQLHVAQFGGEDSQQQQPTRQNRMNGEGGVPGMAQRIGGAGANQEVGGTKVTSAVYEVREIGSRAITFSNFGTLESTLDKLVSELGIHWKYEDDGVTVYKKETKKYNISVMSGSSSHDGRVSSSTASSGTANTSSNYTSSNSVSNPDIWEVIGQSIRGVLSPGGSYVASPQTGTVEVTDDPEVHKKVAKIVKQYDEDLNRSIMYKVDVVEVVQENLDEFSLNLADLIYENNNRNRFSLTTGALPLDTAASFIKGTVIRPDGRFKDSSALIGAISKRMDVVSHRVIYGEGMNGLTIPIQDVREVTYIAERSETQGQNGAPPSISLTPGVATEGISIFLTGIRSSDGGLILQAAVDLATIESIDTAGTETSFIQTPILAKKNSLARADVDAGSTLIAALLESTVSDNTEAGVGHHKNFLVGGSRQNSTAKRFTVVLVTPYFKAS